MAKILYPIWRSKRLVKEVISEQPAGTVLRAKNRFIARMLPANDEPKVRA